MDLSIEPKYKKHNGADPIAYVASMNIKCRHLNKSQLATIAVEMEPLLAEEAKKRQQHHGSTAPGKSKTLSPKSTQVKGKALKIAADIVGVGLTTAGSAKYVKKHDPELFKRVEIGEVTADTASCSHLCASLVETPASLRASVLNFPLLGRLPCGF